MGQDTLIIHPSRNPKIFFAGGDLGGQESQKRFDGIIAFVAEKYRPSNLKRFCMPTITCPKVVFGLNNNSCPELKKDSVNDILCLEYPYQKGVPKHRLPRSSAQ